MGHIYDQMLLRNEHRFRDFVHAAILYVATQIQQEDVDTLYHNARVKMAEKLIDTSDAITEKFIKRMIFRAIMHDTIRSSVVKNGEVILSSIDEDKLTNGVLTLWNEVALFAWPELKTVL